ncbi:hypothetical protein WA538_002003, partial [Blastocystis sp. DL]
MDQDILHLGSNQALKNLPQLIQQVQKNKNPLLISELLNLFTTMCERNYQYVERLCRLGILDILKSYLLHENTTVRENAVIFLTFIVQQYASPAKIFARSQQFENAIRQSLLGTDFVFVLFHMVSQPDLPLSLLTAVFSCLSQYTNEISLSGDECMETLVATNMWLSELLPSTHCLCFPSAASPSPDLDPLLIAICKTLSAHFTTLSRVMYLVASCVLPSVLSLLSHKNAAVIAAALHVVGCVVALDRSDAESFDCTDYMLDCCVMQRLRALLQTPNREMKKETCWILSNIVAGSEEQIQAVIDSECVEQVARLLRPPVADEVKSEACWVYLNGVTCGNEEQVDYFVRMGVVEVLQEMIHNNLHNGDVFDALEAVIKAGDSKLETDGRNPYVDRMNISLLHEASVTPSSFQKQALSFFTTYFVACGICHRYYFRRDPDLTFCSECNCFVCSGCDCSVFHLDYQLAHWDEEEEKKVEEKKVEGKKKGKKKRKGQGGKKEVEMKGVDPEAMKRFQKLLKVYYKEYDMLEVS